VKTTLANMSFSASVTIHSRGRDYSDATDISFFKGQESIPLIGTLLLPPTCKKTRQAKNKYNTHI
jgi:hypothetical protein